MQDDKFEVLKYILFIFYQLTYLLISKIDNYFQQANHMFVPVAHVALPYPS